MSGWIKLEKDRKDDPRVIRMARELRNASVTHERFTSSIHVTLVLGCLDVLWCYADTHIREDDTLDLGADEIDELVGLKDFCRLMPADWLEIIDSNRVKLPDFHAHNGTESKKKALSQKRQERHRNSEALRDLKPASRTSVTSALPDLDQTKTKTREEEASAEFAERFAEFKALYPRRSGDQRWPTAEKHIRARLREGSTWDEILDGVKRYAQWVRAAGKEGTETVKQAATFVGTDKGFIEAFEIPRNGANQQISKPRPSAVERVYAATAHLVGDSGRVGLEGDGGALRSSIPDGIR